MRPHRRRHARAAAVIAAATAVGLLPASAVGLLPASAATPATAAKATRILKVSPSTSQDTLAPGYKIGPVLHGGSCEAGSDVISGVYRCFAGNGVYDPCWADSASPTIPDVDCLAAPWEHTVVRVYLDAPLQPSPGGPFYVWGVQLAGGARCIAAQGAHGSFDGKIVNYFCGNGYTRVLLGQPNKTGPVWRIREAIFHKKTGRYTLGSIVNITTAYYGLPSTLRTP